MAQRAVRLWWCNAPSTSAPETILMLCAPSPPLARPDTKNSGLTLSPLVAAYWASSLHDRDGGGFGERSVGGAVALRRWSWARVAVRRAGAGAAPLRDVGRDLERAAEPLVRHHLLLVRHVAVQLLHHRGDRHNGTRCVRI